MSEKITIEAKKRAVQSPNKTRSEGLIPAVIYGHNIPSTSLSVPYQLFEKAFRKAGESTIVTLDIEGQPHNVIIQDVQRHYLNNKYQHVDFYEVSMTEKMTATVPLEFVGVAKAVKESGGTMVHVLSEVEVECLPGDLPNHIEVDISVLNTFDDSIHVADLKVAKGVTILAEPEEMVAKVDAPRDVEAELAVPIVEDISKVEGAAEVKPEDAAAAAEKAPGKSPEKSPEN